MRGANLPSRVLGGLMKVRGFALSLTIFFLLTVSFFAAAFQPKSVKNSGPVTLSSKEFFLPELRLSSTQVPLADISKDLKNTGAWNSFFNRQKFSFQVYFDPRSG